MPQTFTLYGRKWRLPKLDYQLVPAAAAGDNEIRVPLGGKPWLLFSAQVVNRTTNNLKQHIKIIRSQDAAPFPDDRFSLAQQKIQQNDDGTTWTFDPPKMITGNRLIGFIEDCLLNDELILQYVMAAEA